MSVQQIVLVAAFNASGELLLLKRPDEVHCGGLWSLPGGKIMEDESSLAAARRELLEETGLAGTSWQPLGESSHDYPDRRLHFLLYACRCTDLAGFRPESEAAWISLTDLAGYPMPAANRSLVPMLRLPVDARPS